MSAQKSDNYREWLHTCKIGDVIEAEALDEVQFLCADYEDSMPDLDNPRPVKGRDIAIGQVAIFDLSRLLRKQADGSWKRIL